MFCAKTYSNYFNQEAKYKVCHSYYNDVVYIFLENETKDVHQCQTSGNNMCCHYDIQDSGKSVCFSCCKIKSMSRNIGNSSVHKNKN